MRPANAHARRRMNQRRISEAEINEALLNRETQYTIVHLTTGPLPSVRSSPQANLRR
jgi:hypothetical protein